tara:strand:+ start:8647 stop:9705 length:1059 start_codon:yes stop_codon:yes gene_type:complete
MDNMVVDLNGTKVGPGFPPYLIAEISANHNGSFENAKKLIKLAKENGANAVKLQTYTADTITLNSNKNDFVIHEGPWAGQTLHQLYESAHTPWDWHEPLFKLAKKIGIDIFSSPFDETAVDFLERLGAPFYKIASFEAIDIPLIECVASTKKPVIISTGMADKQEIGEALEVLRKYGSNKIILLHCISAYPAPTEEYNLSTLKDLSSSFNLPVGLSDHTVSSLAASISLAFGACVVEKHFTLDKRGGGPDDFFSMEPGDLNNLSENLMDTWKAIGSVNYGLSSSEAANVKFRKSIYFIKDIKRGETITKDHIKCVRPGYGMKPKYFKQLIGKQVEKDINAFSPVEKETIRWI